MYLAIIGTLIFPQNTFIMFTDFRTDDFTAIPYREIAG